MFMVCRECGRKHSSAEVRESKLLTYVSGDSDWHKCITDDSTLDEDDRTVIGYDGCRGWP